MNTNPDSHRRHWFTVLEHCCCGCDANGLHHVLATDAKAAASFWRDGAACGFGDSECMPREVEILAVFKGRLQEQADIL